MLRERHLLLIPRGLAVASDRRRSASFRSRAHYGRRRRNGRPLSDGRAAVSCVGALRLASRRRASSRAFAVASSASIWPIMNSFLA